MEKQKRLYETSLKKQYVAINSSSVCSSVYYPGNLLQKAPCTCQLNLNLKEKFGCFEDFTDKIGNADLNNSGPSFFTIYNFETALCNKKRYA